MMHYYVDDGGNYIGAFDREMDNLIEVDSAPENALQKWDFATKRWLPLELPEEYKSKMRKESYREESDPIFFQWQRGEATEQEWRDKVKEIKERY